MTLIYGDKDHFTKIMKQIRAKLGNPGIYLGQYYVGMERKFSECRTCSNLIKNSHEQFTLLEKENYFSL